MVGAVVVHDRKVISEGFTSEYGGPHAEVNAINGVDESVLRASALYVSLEPCAHHGQTPPCSDIIIGKGIPKVVIGCRDPFSEVNGKGIEKLRAAGIHVTEGVLEKECLELNRRFMTFHQKKRPYVILKWAESADGFIDRLREGGKASVISSPETAQLVHQWRADEQAILIGGETARKDNPSLTVRYVDGPDPQRYVWTQKGLSPHLKLSEIGFESLNADSVEELLSHLYSKGIQSVLVEGGAKVLQQLIEAEAYDEVRRIIGKENLEEGVEAPVLKAKRISEMRSGADVIEFY
jgi:diaminohydroxyphosphoribosylaminopyrimidine deaminase/5-amino-6-(5-phosphoribosylamino)uracil reductase